MQSSVPYLSVVSQYFLRSNKQLVWSSPVLLSCMSQLHTLLYLPTTIPLVDPIFGLLSTCGDHPCMVWLPFNISPSAHICHISSTVSRFSPSFSFPNCPLLSPYRLLYIPVYCVIVTHTSAFGVWNNQWNNSATLSGKIQQLVTINCEEIQSPLHYKSLVLSPSETKCKLSHVAVECVHSVQSVEHIGMVQEEMDIFGRGKVNLYSDL
jgi:hypothetical protein